MPRNGPLAGSATFPLQHTVTAGTDGATIAAFDAAALPVECDARVDADPHAVLAALQAEGRRWFGGAGGDVEHVVRVLVDEEPREVAGRAPAHRGRLTAPSGGLWVCGAECAANDPLYGSAATSPGGLGRYDMGARVDVPRGDYELAVCERHGDGRDDETWPAAPVLCLTFAPFALRIVGTIAAVAATLALVVAVPWTLVQWATDDQRAIVGWQVVPWMLAASADDVAVGWCALALGRRIDRLPAVVRTKAPHAAARAARPDVVLVLRRRGDAAGPR
ncbi:MAG: hypothetical protein ACK533_11390 [Planctomycetota bacterium]